MTLTVTASNPHPNPLNLTPHRAGIATLPGQDSARNQDRKALLIGPGSRRGSAAHTPRSQERIGTPRRQSRTPTRRGQHPNPRLKKNSQSTLNRSTYPDPHPLPDGSPWPPTNAKDSYSARRSGSALAPKRYRVSLPAMQPRRNQIIIATKHAPNTRI